jgi:hypothetical protein
MYKLTRLNQQGARVTVAVFSTYYQAKYSTLRRPFDLILPVQ